MIVTSSTRELLPVVSIQGLNLAARGTEVCDKLRNALLEYVHAYVARHKAAQPA